MNNGIKASLIMVAIIAMVAIIGFCIINCPWVLILACIGSALYGIWRWIKTGLDEEDYYN